MKTLVDSIDEESLRALAKPSDFRLGREIFEQGGVEIVEAEPFRATAKARPSDGQRRTVELMSTKDGVMCKCT